MLETRKHQEKMERKKPISLISDTVPVENDKQFLERSGASLQIRDVIAKVLENRPADPVNFLAEHFESLGDKVDKVAKATKQVTNTHYTKPAFANNLFLAYDTLAGHTKGQPVKGLGGSVYMELLHSLCKTYPPTVRDNLFKKIRCKDFEVVPFDVFRSSVFTCLVLKDFLGQTEALYQSLDLHKSGRVDATLCDAVTKQLRDAVAGTTSNPASVIQAGYMLGPKRLHASVSSAFLKSSGDKKILSQDEFVINAADSFLSKVHRLR